MPFGQWAQLIYSHNSSGFVREFYVTRCAVVVNRNHERVLWWSVMQWKAVIYINGGCLLRRVKLVAELNCVL